MSYVVLARKWRPMRFEDLVGQDHVARTLGNAIEAGRVAHAFLFTGVRGVGKTTSARILAKALNCMGAPGSRPTDTDPGPTVSPCLECPACREIALGTDMDVREIDGASYNGVDEVRKLQDSLPYRPTRDRYKIFIVDEVHMLSAAAWNAFLKTLEEPPPHVKFIFATTEVHKVPVTILSRVQRFDFKMISTRAIAERLRYVLEQEKIEADEAGVNIVAREAAGSMRDAMSLLDQVIAFSGARFSADDVARALGVASRQALHDLARGLVEGDAARCLALVDSVAEQGFDIPHVARDVLALLRDLVVIKVVPDPTPLLDLADGERQDLAQVAQAAEPDDLLRLHQGFSRGYDEVVRSPEPRAALEMLLVRLARRPPLVPIDDLIARLGQLERRLGATNVRPRGREGESRSSTTARAAPSQRDEPPAGPEAASPAGAHERAARPSARIPEDAPRLVATGAAVALAPASESAGTEPASRVQTRPSRPAPTLTPTPAPLAAVRPEPVEGLPEKPAPGGVPSSSPLPLRRSVPPPPPPVSAEEVARLERFAQVVERVRQSDLELAAYLEQAVPLSVGGERLEVAFEPGFVFQAAVTTHTARTALQEAARVELGDAVELVLRENFAEALPHRTLSAQRERERAAVRDAAIQRARNHPRVVDAIEILGARLKDVKLADG
jgi:DNA polymerase-3 subunit gamma/tau